MLFLDDERSPEDVTWALAKGTSYKSHRWSIVRCFYSACDYIIEYGCPDFISFDHDLGEEKSGLDFAKWLIEQDMDAGILPDNFSFSVHSMNPVGAKNIKDLLDNYLDFKKTKNII